jgi:predicted nucleic acid-binding protein
LVAFVIQGQHTPALGSLLESSAIVFAPALVQAEAANALWKYVKSGQLEREEAIILLERALALVDDLVEKRGLASEALVAAATYDHPVYDMFYAVLARRLGCPVITLDRRFVKILEKMRVSVETPLS